MTAEKFSVNRLCLLTYALVAIVISGESVLVYWMTNNVPAIFICLLGGCFIFVCMTAFIFVIRKKLTAFSDALCRQLDDMMTGSIGPSQFAVEESLFYKISHRLFRLYEIMQKNRQNIAKERENLQELISDVSHQVKTPIANLKIIDATLLEQNIGAERQREFLAAMEGQLDKLDFLMQALVKTSRLETGIISLEKKKQPIYDTLAAALGGILLNAEKKNIEVSVDCPESVEIVHDKKWTGEALFNILDNAVKYTPDGGKIGVKAEKWDMYLKIDISDNGRGIPEKHHAAIFKRFYRETEVHDIDGIGIGLYLAREIITLQGGYVKVVSAPQKGATFSVFLPILSFGEMSQNRED